MGTLNVSNINGAQLGGFRNLIINGNFQVNQRGHYSITEETSGTTATGYHYDRWYYNNSDSYLYQGVEDKSVANGTYTLSWVDAGSDITAAEYVISTDTTAGDGPDSGLTWNQVSNGGNITVNEGTEYSKHLWIRFGGTLSNLSKVQLEHGTQATPFEHRPYATELALCQRYCHVLSATTERYNFLSTNFTGALTYYKVYYPTFMRVAPSGTSTLIVNTYSAATAIAVSASVTVNNTSTYSAQLRNAISGVAGYVSHSDIQSGSIIFDAEL